MISNENIAEAIATGRRQANNVVNFRNGQLLKRTRAIVEAPRIRRAPGIAEVKAETVRELGPEAGEVLVAEGDSWFDYPFHDVLRLLEDHHGYDVESVAHKGDRIEEMAYADGQLEEFTRLIEKLLRRGAMPRAILLSGGGNDLAGKEFGMLLNHAASAIAGINDSIMTGVIDERVQLAYITIISKITEVCLQRTGNVLPIIIHGYDYSVPDGRGFLGGWWYLPGPWLEPGFREKDFSALQGRIDMTKTLMDHFNEMLQRVAALPDFHHVQYIDLRGTLSVAIDDYKNDWANELHPTADGFAKVTNRFAEVIESLPG